MENRQKREEMKALKRCVTGNRVALVEDLNVNGLLLAHMQQQGLLTSYDMEVIGAERTRHDKAEKVLDTILTKGPDFVDKFIRALQDTHQDHLADILLESLEKVSLGQFAPMPGRQYFPGNFPSEASNSPFANPVTFPDSTVQHIYNAGTVNVHHNYGSGDPHQESLYQRGMEGHHFTKNKPSSSSGKRKPAQQNEFPSFKLPPRDTRSELVTAHSHGQTFWSMDLPYSQQQSDNPLSSLKTSETTDSDNTIRNPMYDLKAFLSLDSEKIAREQTRIDDESKRLLYNVKTSGMSFRGETPADGNCFFHAVADQCNRLRLHLGISHTEIRALTVSYLQKHQHDYAPFIDCQWDLYLKKMSEDGEWTDHAAIDATAKALGCKIHIVTSSPGGAESDILETIVNENGKNATLLLGHYHEMHYQSLEMANETDPLEDMDVTVNIGTDFIDELGKALNEEEMMGSKQKVSIPCVEMKPNYKFNSEICAYEFSQEDLELITNRFSDEIASEEKCGFGVVHKGELKQGQLNGLKVAVKRLSDSNDNQGKLEFDREKDWAKTKYVYLLTAMGVCEGCTGRYSKAVVTVFMDGGTLKDRLELANSGQKDFDWKTRLRISIQLADAVKYLQTSDNQSKCTVHRDIKSSNIFLDENDNIRLGDMGFAKMYSLNVNRKKTVTQTFPFAAGYSDPKIHVGLITDTTDCYSMGVVFEELLTGVLASEMDTEDVSLHVSWNNSEDEVTILKAKGKQQGWPDKVCKNYAELIMSCKEDRPIKRIKVGVLFDELVDLYKDNVEESVYKGKDGQPIQSDKCLYCLLNKTANTPMTCGCKFLCMKCIEKHSEQKTIQCMFHLEPVKVKKVSASTCDGDFTKLFNTSQPIIDVLRFFNANIHLYHKSVGLIKAIKTDGTEVAVATGFKLGQNFLMTNWHVAAKFKGHMGAKVQFGYLKETCATESSATYTIVSLIWHNLMLDVAVLLIQNTENTDTVHVPDLYCDIGDIQPGEKVYIIGHDNCEVMKVDPDCLVRSYPDLQKEMDTFLKFNQWADFNGAADRYRMLLKSSFMHGASGSPCFDENGRLVLMYANGFPTNYKALGMKETLFEQGVRIQCIFDLLRKEDPELASTLFPRIK